MSIRDPQWKYNADTDVERTWRRFGFRPTTAADRRARQRGKPVAVVEAPELAPAHETPLARKLRAVGRV